MLEVQDVCAGYNGTEIVHHISFQLEMGENMCILGANGCGKTTLLRAIGNLMPFSGSVKLDGVEIRTMKRRKIAEKIALLSQISSTYFSYTVYDTVMLGRYQHIKNRLYDRPGKADKEMVEKCLETVGLSDLAYRRIDELSGGQLQRVFLAKTLAQDPQIILLDEPTNHLDTRQQVELIQHLRRWSDDQRHAVIGVFHDLNLALRLSDKVLFMKDGSAEAFGNMKDVASRMLLQKVYGMDIAGYMDEQCANWKRLEEQMKEGEHVYAGI